MDGSAPAQEQWQPEWPQDAQWESLGDGQKLHPGAWRRLRTVDRSVYAMNRILELLFKDRMGKHMRDESGLAFEGMAPIDAEALEIAAMELGSRVEELLEEVRDGSFQ